MAGKNQEIAKIFREIAELWDINSDLEGAFFRARRYQKIAEKLENLSQDIRIIYQKEGLAGIQKALHAGKSIAKKIEEYLKTGGIKKYYAELERLKETVAIREIVTHFFKSKGIPLEKIKMDAKKQKIMYSRFTKPAKQLLELAGSVEKAKQAIDKVAEWANSRGLDYAIETVFKKWLELDRLKPKEIVKKPYYRGDPMVWSETRRKWYVIDPGGEWLEFAGKESDIEWRMQK